MSVETHPPVAAAPGLADLAASLPPEMLASSDLSKLAADLPGGTQLVVVDEPIRRLPFIARSGIVLIPLTLIVAAWGGAASFFPHIREGLAPTVPTAERSPPNGAALFAQNCASCHGERGDGNGTASLSIKARYFGAEKFKFTDTDGTNIPTTENLLGVLHRGIEGSSMPSFAQLPEDDLAALVAHVRGLTRKGRYEALYQVAAREFEGGTGDEPDPAALSRKADASTVVGKRIAVPAAFAASTPDSVERGRKLFLTNCAACHGEDGAGKNANRTDLKNDNGTPARPRVLTSGVFKGGREKPQLYARIRLGIPGTPMPGSPLFTDAEVNDTLNYVLSLSPEPGQVAKGK